MFLLRLIAFVFVYVRLEDSCDATQLGKASPHHKLSRISPAAIPTAESSRALMRSSVNAGRHSIKAAVVPLANSHIRQNRLALVTKPGATATAAPGAATVTLHPTITASPYNGGPSELTTATRRPTASPTPRQLLCPVEDYRSYGEECGLGLCCRYFTQCAANAAGTLVCGNENGCTGGFQDPCDPGILTNGGSKCCSAEMTLSCTERSPHYCY